MLLDEITLANRRLVKYFLWTIFVVFVFGLIIPIRWEEYIGPLNTPITWAANNIPSITKLSAISPNPELVRGFFGFAFWCSILSAIFISARDPLGSRLLFGFSRPGVSVFKSFLFVYFLSLPILMIALWIVLWLPIVISLEANKGGAMRLLVSMVQDRFFMAAIGSVCSASIALLIWLLMVILVGPIRFIKSRSY